MSRERERENREVAGKLTEKMKTAWKVLKLSQNYSQFHEDLLNWQHSLSDNESSLVPLTFSLSTSWLIQVNRTVHLLCPKYAAQV